MPRSLTKKRPIASNSPNNVRFSLFAFRIFGDPSKVDAAAQAYVKAAKCESDEALTANYFVDAATSMKKQNTTEAVKLLEQAIEVFCATGGLRMVLPDGRLTKQIGSEV